MHGQNISPVKFYLLKEFLVGYPPIKLRYLEDGFENGFQLGYQGDVTPLDSPRTPRLTPDLAQILQEKIGKEIHEGRVAGPFDQPPFHPFRCSPIRLEPKKEPGEYRVIHNLSYPFQHPTSINSGIPQEHKAVTYAMLDEAVEYIQTLGKTVYLAKTDIKSAFKIIPVDAQDYHLLGFKWANKYYYAKTLPMGAASSCAIFESFSTALQYAAQSSLKVQKCLHVLDDFLFIASSYDRCMQDLKDFLSMCQYAHIPIANDKTIGPAEVLEFLGITIHIPLQCTQLPANKVSRCIALLESALTKRKLSLLEIQQLLGHLNFACKAVVPGRPFLSALYATMKRLKKRHHKICLPTIVCEDLLIWKTFLSTFNGNSLFLTKCDARDQSLELYTDASTGVGFGACFGHEWVCGSWSESWKNRDILVLELYAVVLATVIWGAQLANKDILLHIDNKSLVHIINRGHTSSEQAIPLLRILYLQCLKFNIQFRAQHIPGVMNVSADALSRLQIQVFRKSLPHAAYLPRKIPDWVDVQNFKPWKDPITSYPL